MPTQVLVRSSWQTVNIGDVAHSPGTLHAFRRVQQDVDLVLWPWSLDAREREMFARYLPEVRVIDGELDADGEPTTAELRRAWQEADVLVHGSGPGPVRAADVRVWQQRTGKPSAFFGITVDPWERPQPYTLAEQAMMIDTLPPGDLPPERRDVFAASAFLYCRDSLSMRYLQRQEVTGPVLDLGPDATLLHRWYDDAAADRTLEAFALQEGRYLCVVPRLRWTPYHRIPGRGVPASREMWRRDAVNAVHVHADMAPMRAAIEAWVRESGGQVLICPEMSYAVETGERYLAHGYPDDIQPHVKHLDRYWQLQEAAAVYRRAAGVLSQECHSPLLATAAGVPSLYVREPTDTVKGQMYDDLGLPMAEVQRDGTPAVLRWLRDLVERPEQLRASTVLARDRAHGRLDEVARTVLAGVT